MRLYSRKLLIIVICLTLIFFTPFFSQFQGTGRRSDLSTNNEEWGRIANSQYQNQKIITALFFAGPPNPNSLPLYTRHPKNAALLDWSSDADIDFAMNQMRNIGLNVIKVSYWGHQGETDSWCPSLLFSKYDWTNRDIILNETEIVNRANHCFNKANENDLLFAPMLEVSSSFPFYIEFPTDLTNMIQRITWLLTNFGNQPNWLKVYDKNGEERIAFFLIETIHLGTIDPTVFAQGFDTVASQIESNTGYKIGFIIDPTPLPAYGSTEGPTPETLANINSILAVNPFNIFSQGASGNPEPVPESDRLDYAESVVSYWTNTSLPFIIPFLPGYDAHIVFPSFPIYGFTDNWLTNQKNRLISYPNVGVSFDCWNGYTEGYAIVPTIEDNERIYNWANSIVSYISPTSVSSTSVSSTGVSESTSSSNGVFGFELITSIIVFIMLRSLKNSKKRKSSYNQQ